MILHAPDGRVLELGEREWTVLAQMDGTRDREGIREAARGAGAPVRADHLDAFVEELSRLGVLATEREGEEGGDREPAFPPDRPISPLPDYRFACDGRGGCCRSFGTVLFTPLETAVARAALPEVEGAGQDPERAFLPERGLDRTLSAATMCDGECAYLEDDGRCRLHVAAGAAAKPFGCRTFPALFVDTGSEIRVVPRPECACVFESASRADGASLVRARRGSELPRETFVPAVPDARLGGTRVEGRDFVAWCDGLRMPDTVDPVAWCWSLARAVEVHGVDARVGEASPPDEEVLRSELRRLGAAVARLADQHRWRAADDLVRRSLGWVAAACRRPPSMEPPSRAQAVAERLYVRAALHAALPAFAESVEADLRQRALRLLLARGIPPEARAHPPARHPLAIVEALARGHGLG